MPFAPLIGSQSSGSSGTVKAVSYACAEPLFSSSEDEQQEDTLQNLELAVLQQEERLQDILQQQLALIGAYFVAGG